MTWPAQVGHVLAKDLRQGWRPLAVYAGLVALATARAMGWTALASPVLGSLPILVAVAGLLTLAMAVQADSPTRPDAFWVAHPLRPTAVAAAKVALGLLVLGIGLLGQLVAVHAFGVRGRALAEVAGGPASVYGGWLLGAMLVAALVRDFKGFALTLVSVPVVLLMSSFVAAGLMTSGTEPATPGSSRATWLVQLVTLAAVLGLLAWIYRARDARLRTRVLGFAAAVAVVVALGATPADALHDAPAATERYALALQLRPDPRSAGAVRTAGSGLNLAVRGSAMPFDRRLVIVRPVVTVELRDGSTLRLVPPRRSVDLNAMTEPLPRLSGIRWLHEPARTDRAASLQLELSPTERRALAAGVARVTLDGRAVVIGVEPVATLPLASGAAASARGRRVRVARWSYELGEAALQLDATVVGRAARERDAEWADFGRGLQAALVNRTRGEAIDLEGRGGSGGTSWLVLPGTPVLTETREYVWPGPGSVRRTDGPQPEPAVDAAWMGEASLLVMTQAVRGSYPVRLELVVP